MRRHIIHSALAIGALAAARATPAQEAPAGVTPVSRAQAVESALARGARLGVARADTAVARAQLLAARARQNPTLTTEYTKSVPQYHVTLDLPLDYPWLRGTRIRSAEAGRLAAQYRFQLERASVALDADTTYTRVLAALAHARLSRHNSGDADSLRRMAVARRDAGDASDLDVELAAVSAGQQANVAAADSLAFLSAVLDLQSVMGLAANRVALAPSDSLTLPSDSVAAVAVSDTVTGASVPGGAGGAGGAPLQVAAAQAALESARLSASLARRSVFGAPSVTAGFETRDPTGGERGLLPLVGISLPLPLLDRARGPIVQAAAERERARAELALAQVESQAALARALRERSIALAKVERDRRLVAAADRVAAMSLTAYREGAASLPNVLEAQRNARDVVAQYVDDLAAAWNATAALRVLTLTPARTAQR
ncbi:MAG: TolC family protein [Gemmatimonadaceae bacterium]